MNETTTKTVTLADIKARDINHAVASRMIRRAELSAWNRRAKRIRFDEGNIDGCVADIIQDGNDPRDNEELLDVARCYIEAGIYTDQEWQEVFIPAINTAMAYNDAFVRWYPGYLIRNRRTGMECIVQYDYAMGFESSMGRPCRDFTSLTVCSVDGEGRIRGSWAWAHYEDYELVDKDHTKENIAKVREYLKGQPMPFFLSQEMQELFFI